MLSHPSALEKRSRQSLVHLVKSIQLPLRRSKNCLITKPGSHLFKRWHLLSEQASLYPPWKPVANSCTERPDHQHGFTTLPIPHMHHPTSPANSPLKTTRTPGH